MNSFGKQPPHWRAQIGRWSGLGMKNGAGGTWSRPAPYRDKCGVAGRSRAGLWDHTVPQSLELQGTHKVRFFAHRVGDRNHKMVRVAAVTFLRAGHTSGASGQGNRQDVGADAQTHLVRGVCRVHRDLDQAG